MKKLVLIIGAVVLFTGTVLGQNQQRARIAASGDVNAQTRNTDLAAGTQIAGTLENSLDVKRAKPGDQVILKTKDAVRSNGQVVAKKGSRLIGHVTDVSQRAKGKGDSSLAIVFDRLETGSGQIPLSASITSVLNTTTRTSADNGTLDSDLGMSSSAGTMAQRSPSGGGGTASGGLLGGVTGTVGGITNTTTNTVGGIAGTATQTTGEVVNATGQTVGSTTGALGSTVRGLSISPMASGSVEGGSTLSVANDNLHLDKGTTFLVRIN